MNNTISYEELQNNSGKGIVDISLYEYINKYIEELNKEYNNKINLLDDEIQKWQSESHPFVGGCGDPGDLTPEKVRDLIDKELSEKDKMEEYIKLTSMEVFSLNKKYKKLIKLLPDENKLELLSKWFDKIYENDDNPEVQIDLLKWAKNIREIKDSI